MLFAQRTIQYEVSTRGIGLHSGNEVTLSLLPAPANHGIVFRRTDLMPVVEIQIAPNLVRETKLCTGLVNQAGVRVQTIEHLMAALASFGIDNLIVEVDAAEIPIMDGSSAPFVLLLEEAGIQLQEAPKTFIRILKPVRVQEGDKYAELLPNNDFGFDLEFTIDFNHPAVRETAHSFRFNLSTQGFIHELSNARTFGFLKEIEYLQSIGLCRGGSLNNAIVLDETKIINSEGLRYPDEFVRHKMLDAIGDLYLCNHNLVGSYRAYKSGHDLNNKLISKLLASENAYEVVTYGVNESQAYFNDALSVTRPVGIFA